MSFARNSRGRLVRFSTAVALGLLGATASAAPALAQGEAEILPAPPSKYQEEVYGKGRLPNMFETNVPYVAWRGEQIRAVKCDSALEGAVGADVLVTDWSGDKDFKPQLEAGTLKFFWSSRRKPCISFSMVSHHAGIASVKLVPNDGKGNIVGEKHDFLMIWLTIGNVTIDEVGENDPTGDQPEGSNAEVGDPLGDGVFDAGDPFGRVSVNVTGTFPGSAKLGGGTITLPSGWPAVAAAYATDPKSWNDPDVQRWDIHDDQTKATGHVQGFCLFPTQKDVDAVDNCWDLGGDYGPFSTAFGTGNLGAGPFDPARPVTLLSNGNDVDEDDAPMPPLRVDLKIKPNTGGESDVSGVGQLLKSDKSDVYSRDGSGGDRPWFHNLYAPFYKQFIPATEADRYVPEASGIDGPCRLNNNAGFLFCGLYDNWETKELEWAEKHRTDCNQYVDWRWSIGGANGNTGSASFGYPGPRPDFPDDRHRHTPHGPQTVAVYTDEHGEAQVRYDPYAGGFYYDNLPVVLNDNRGCDLQDVDLLGTSDISAVGRYPYEQVDANDVDAAPAALRKTVYNEFDKSLSYFPKGEGAANQNARIVVAHGNDVDGEPFAGEVVCFYLDDEADGARGFRGITGMEENGEVQPSGRPGGHRPPRLPEGRFMVDGGYYPTVAGDLCRTLDRNGNAAIEVFNSDPQDINVIAEYLDEGLLRDIDVDFSTSGSSGGTPPTVPGGENDNEACGKPPYPRSGDHGQCGPPRGEGTNPPTLQQIQQTAPAAASSLAPKVKTKAKSKRRIAVARVKLRKGKRVLSLRVNSSRRAETVKIRVGRKKAVKRRVVTNRVVTVSGLALTEGVTVTVTLVP
jgi:hypothetical protein